jgi:hypothetical protein
LAAKRRLLSLVVRQERRAHGRTALPPAEFVDELPSDPRVVMHAFDDAAPQAVDPWYALDRELEAWRRVRRTATLWWRDDDATGPTAELGRLFAITHKAAAGLLLAVIPAPAEEELVEVVLEQEHVTVGQHGFAHVNHAPKGSGEGAWELGAHRPARIVFEDLVAGRERLEDMFGNRFLPVVVPPWNRIDPAVVRGLGRRGFIGLSAFGARQAESPARGIIEVNAHCDPIKWKGGARFAGEDKAIGALVEHLHARRTGAADAGEHTGILTHHLALNEEGWAFVEALGTWIAAHPAARWCEPAEAFRPGK